MDTTAKLLLSALKLLLSAVGLLLTIASGLWVYTKYFLERALLPPVQFYVTAEKIGTVSDRLVIVVKIHLKNQGSATLVARNIRLDIRYITAKTASREGLLMHDGRKPKKAVAEADTDYEHVKDAEKPQMAGRLYFPRSLVRDDLEVNPTSFKPAKIREQENRSEWEKFRERVKKWLKSQWSSVLRWKAVGFFVRDRGEAREPKYRGFLVLEDDTFVQPGIDQPYTFTTTLPSDTLCFLTWCSFQYAQKLFGWQKLLVCISRRLGLIHYSLQHANVPHTVEEVFWIGAGPEAGRLKILVR